MYSPIIIEKNRIRASEYLSKRYRMPRGWELTPSSRGEIEEMRAHFNSLLDHKGIPSRALSREESLWTLSQHTLCKIDFTYFSKNFLRIVGWDGRPTFFTPNVGQAMFLRELAKREERGLAQMWQILKARQIGFTTLWQALLAHRIFLYRNVQGITGSASEEKSKTMVGKFAFMWDQLDWWLRPTRGANEAGRLMGFPELNSELRVAWGNQKTGIGRGSTPSVVHLSELAEFENQEELVDASLVRTQHANPFSLMGFESTAKGIGDWWNKTWDFNIKFGAQGLARMQPIFFPWYVATDLYPTKTELKDKPIKEGWIIPDYVERHAESASVYVQSIPMLREGLGSDWTMPIEQKWWYYLQYEEAREKRTIHKLLEELPATPSQAFQSANPTVFTVEVLDMVDNETKGARPWGVFQLSSPQIPLEFRDQRLIGPPLPLVCRDASNFVQESFELQPLKIEGRWPDGDPSEVVYIWEPPQEGEEYGLGIDGAEGADQDNSVITVVKKANGWHPDEQVAEWASRRIHPHDLWMWAFALAHFYTTPRIGGGWWWPRVVIEVNENAGDACQTEMMKRGWPHFHQRIDLTKDNRQMGDIDLKKLGWYTNRATRPRVISMGRKAIRDGLVVVRSPWLAEEMKTLEYNLDKKRIEASQGNHDDRFMALGILLSSWYDPDVYGQETQAWKERRSREAQLAKLPIYRGGVGIGQAPRHFIRKEKKGDSRRMSYGS